MSPTDGDSGPEGTVPPDASTAVSKQALAEGIANLNVGISDSNASFLTGTRFRDIGTKNARGGRAFLRVFVPWNYMALRDKVDAGREPRKCARLSVAKWQGVNGRPGFIDIARKLPNTEIMVVFSGRVFGCDKIQSPKSADNYASQVEKFIKQYDAVDRVTAWNEPNFIPGLRKLPERAARYWKRANDLCLTLREPKTEGPGTRQACGAGPAGDSAAGVKQTVKRQGRRVGYGTAYHSAIVRRNPSRRRPLIWSFHPWGDSVAFTLGNSLKRSKALQTRFYRRRFHRDEYRYRNKIGTEGELKHPRVWNTEIGAIYRLNCGRMKPQSRRDKVCPVQTIPGGETKKRVARYGRKRQNQAGAYLLRKSVLPISNATPVTRLYYYNFADVYGFRHRDGQGPLGFTGRCRQVERGERPNVRKVPKCAEEDSGLIGSEADDFESDTDEGWATTEKVKPPDESRTGALRPIFCLFRDRKPRQIKKARSSNAPRSTS